TNTLEIAEALIDRQVLPEKMRDLLEESISLIYQIRIRNHIKHGTQNEEAHLSPEEVAILEKCYWRILVPLHTSLKKLVHSKELHRQYFEGLCQIDDPQALTKQLKGSTSILEAVLHLPDLSTTRPIYTMKIDALEASITAITEVFSPAVPGETSVQIKALHFPFTRFLRHSLAKKIMEGLDLKQEYTNSAHRVCRLQYGIHDLHFKQSPSNPLMEYAIQSLVSRIAGEYTPPTTLVRFDVEQQGQKKSYPVLISQTIPGENLKTAWPKVTPNRSYTWNLLVAILTRPQDGRISNYIFHEQDLFCVDNDLAFAEPVTRFGPFRTVHFSSAPFCLFPLTTPLDQEVLKEFVALDSVAICKAWVEEIIKKEKEYIQLFTEDERRTLYEKGDCTLTILLKKGCFSTLNFQFWQLQNVIQSAINQKEPLIVENLLKQLVNLKDEKVGDYVYRAYNSDKGTPEEKLERALERRRDTSVTCVEYHKNCLGKIPSFNEIKTLEKYSLKQAKNELFNAFLIESEHAYLKDSQGKSALGANFKELNDPNRETKILVSMNEIIKRSPKKIFSLSFYYSTVLDNRQIESFLHPDLEKIELRHCSNIDNSTVRLIQKKCPQLKELILTGCPKITELGESLFTSRLTFTHLETLEISHTPCTTLIFTAPKLRSLSISYNLALIDLDFEAPSLLQINVKKSDKIRLLPLARKYVIQTLVQTPKDLATAPLWLVNDQEIVRAILTNNGLALQYMQTEFKKDRQIVLNAVTQNGGAFQYATEELKRDREFVLAVVRKNELAFEYVSEEFKNDEEVVLTALQKSASAFKYASKELKNDRRVVLAVVQENGLALEYAFKEFKSDEEVVLAAVRKNASAFKYASEELKSDKRVVLAAVRKNASAFKYASEELKSDRVFVLAAMQQNISVFIYIDKKLKNDRQIVLAGTQKNGQCLRYASPRLKNDREIVLTAIQQDPTVLYYASEKLKNDKEFIEAAVQQNPHAFEYAYEIRYD
ncbi:MAG: DUF4116 domain-containing protein, partial [Parachlamydiaceae bacterium]